MLRASKALKYAIIVLSCLLVAALTVLTVVLVRRATPSGTEASAAGSIMTADGKDFRFDVSGMMPGDSETKDFAVTLDGRAAVTVRLNPTLTKEEKNLSEVLRLRVVDAESGAVLCDGRLSDLVGHEHSVRFPAGGTAADQHTFRVTVTMDLSATSDYENAAAVLSFAWSAATVQTEGGEA